MAHKRRGEFVLSENKVGLRRLRFSDIRDIYEHVNDKQIAKWTVAIPHPYKTEDAEEFIRLTNKMIRQNKRRTFGIIYKETDSLVGIIDLFRINWTDRNGEIGYWIGRKFWNRGVATEAIHLILKYAFKELKLHRIYARIFEDNIASARALEKNGFKHEGLQRHAAKVRNRWRNFHLYAILSTEFRIHKR
ncbi:MAG: GNAT family N-acetyltransferase [candidate division Zixibacteria bacterium]|nr:GNAT family N-acetyltransferase [candidate division Zixibacteria bacterium]